MGDYRQLQYLMLAIVISVKTTELIIQICNPLCLNNAINMNEFKPNMDQYTEIGRSNRQEDQMQ